MGGTCGFFDCLDPSLWVLALILTMCVIGFTWVCFGTGELICYAKDVESLRKGVTDQVRIMGEYRK